MSALTFDWHKENRESFRSWIVINLIAYSTSPGKGEEFFDKVKEASDNFTNCEITIQINGIEVDAEQMLDRIAENMEWQAERKAKEIVKQLPGFSDIEEALEIASKAIKKKFLGELKNLGISVSEDDYFYS